MELYKNMSETKKEQTVSERYLEIANAVVEESLQAATQKLNVQFDGVINNKLSEIEKVIAVSLGVKNEKATFSPSSIRKAVLEATESQKKTPAAIEKAGPTGSKSTNPIDNLYDKFGEDKK